MKLVVGGDICITEDSWNIYKKNGINRLFSSEVIELFHSSDFSVANIECPLTDSNNKILKSGPNLKASADAIRIFEDLGLTHASLANNHILDFGIKGVEDTISAFTSRNISLIGVSDQGPYAQIMEKNGQKVGIISIADDEFNGQMDVGDRINVYDPLTSFDQIRVLKQKTDSVIVLFHSGLEHYQYPTPQLQRICRKMVECGANFVACQHSHCIGACEKYNKGLILYGQGNTHFYRSGNTSAKWNTAILVELQVDKDGQVGCRFVYVSQDNGCVGIEIENPEQKSDFLKRSAECKDSLKLQNNFEEFCDVHKKTAELYCLRGYSSLRYYFERITKSKYMKYTFPQKKSIVTSNVIRSSVHNEVIRCILKKMNYG